MPILYGQVGPPSNTSAADGSQLPLLQGKQGELLLSEVHGKYYTQASRGNLFWASNPAAGATLSIVNATTSVAPFVWNPNGSGRNIALISVIITPTTAATTASGYGYAYLTNAGAGSALTGMPIAAFVTTGVLRGSGFLGPAGAGNSVGIFGISSTLTSAPTFLRGMGGSVGTAAITVPSVQPTLREDFDGTIVLPQGAAFFVGTTIATSGQTATQVSIIWEEVPI